MTQATLSRRNLKTEGSFSENASNVFRSNYTGDIRSLVIFRDILDLCLNNTRAGKNHDYRNRIVFEKFFFSCFLSTLKRKPGVLKFLGFEECFWKAPFSWRTSVDGRPNRRNKSLFSNSSMQRCGWASYSPDCAKCCHLTLPFSGERQRIKCTQTDMNVK